MKITKREFIAQSEAFLGRELTAEEVDSLRVCECGQRYCSGWTGEFDLLQIFPQPLEV